MSPQNGPSEATSSVDKVEAFIAFAQVLQQRLPSSTTEDDSQPLVAALQDQIKSLGSCSVRDKKRFRYDQLDIVGAALWNVSIQESRASGGDVSPARRKVLVLSRVLALLIISLAFDGKKNESDDLIRLSKLAINTGRSCIVAGEYDFAVTALQKAAEQNDALQNLWDRLPEDEVEACKVLEAECFILRTTLHWKQGRLDVAEHTYAKAHDLRQILGPKHAQSLADALFEIGRGLIDRHDFVMAAKWLRRGFDFLNNQDLEQLSRDGIELRLALAQALVQALLGVDNSESLQEADSHVSYLESELGDKPLVLLLRLEVLMKAPGEVFDSNAYANVLRRLTRTMDLSESSYNIMIDRIKKLDDKSPSLACQILDEFLSSSIILSHRDDWLGRAIVFRVYMSTKHRDAGETAQRLRSILDSIQDNAQEPLKTEPALAILTLLWKRIDTNLTQGRYDVAEEWCRLAMHPVLEQVGPVNSAKIARRLLHCALQRNDLTTAKDVFSSMNQDTQAQPETLYLTYKLAIRNGDRDMASKCLQAVAESSSTDPGFLYACCVEAQESGDKVCALEALSQLARKYEFSNSSPIHFPALIRVIIRLQVAILHDHEQTNIDRDLLVEDICHAFEGVVASVQRDPRDQQGNRIFSVAELSWFCKNAYNLGLKHTESWKLRQIVRIFQACINIIDHFPKDLPAHELGDLSLRGMFCNFLVATACIALARSDDNVETRLQDYLLMRKHVECFDLQFAARGENMDEEFINDLTSKLALLLVFDFEGAVCLKSWDDLGTIVRKAGPCKDPKVLQAMADCLLRAQNPPAQVLYSTLRAIINEIWLLERFDIDKLAKYMRYLLQATISTNSEWPLRIIEETSQRVKQAAQTDKPFPMVELEWMATTAFNHGVDLYKAKEDELSRKWIEVALTLAHHHTDGGQLEQLLQEHYTHLKWD